MNDDQFRAFLILIMCSDPWPVNDINELDNQTVVERLLDKEARQRGFTDWIDASHKLV